MTDTEILVLLKLPPLKSGRGFREAWPFPFGGEAGLKLSCLVRREHHLVLVLTSRSTQ